MTDDAERLRRRGRFVELASVLEARAEPEPEASGGPFREGGRDLGEEAGALHELGRVQWQLARYPAAEQSLGRALAIREDLLGAEDARTIDTRERLAALYHYRRDDRARPLFERVVAARIAAHGAGSVEVAIAERNFGAYLRDEGDDGHAHALLGRAVEVLGKRLDGEHPDYAAALKARAMLHVQTGGTSFADVERAYEVTIRAHDVDHPFAGAALLLVARVELAHRRFRPARRHLEEAMVALRNGYGDEHPLLAVATIDLGHIASAEGDPAAALAAWSAGIEQYVRWYPRGTFQAAGRYLIAAGHAELGDRQAAARWVEQARASLSADDDAAVMIGHVLRVAEAAASGGDRAMSRELLRLARELDEPAREWQHGIELAERVIDETLAEQPDA